MSRARAHVHLQQQTTPKTPLFNSKLPVEETPPPETRRMAQARPRQHAEEASKGAAKTTSPCTQCQDVPPEGGKGPMCQQDMSTGHLVCQKKARVQSRQASPEPQQQRRRKKVSRVLLHLAPMILLEIVTSQSPCPPPAANHTENITFQ